MHVEVGEIRRKLVNAPWPKYLRALRIQGLRGWGQTAPEIRFDFPVSVVAGENGAGKSTVLKAAAAAYAHPTDKMLSFYPAQFFPDTPWERISNVTLTYKIREGTSEPTLTSRKRTERWRLPEPRPRRHVLWQDVSRTLPLDATAGYARLAKRSATEVATTALQPEIITYYSAILGRRYEEARLAQSSVDQKRQVGVVRLSGSQFSQFHQGAGEDATLDLLHTLQSVPNYALVLIDEVEASLHPRAQRRLVHFLLWLARTKQLQVILSTHSSYVLEELPLDARIFIQRTAGQVEVLYGVTSNYALNRMDDLDHPDLVLFTEDAEGAELAREILRSRNVDLSRMKMLEVGPANVVETLGRLGNQSRLPVRALGVLDADKDVRPGCLRLPGKAAPERQVIEDILNSQVTSLAARLGQLEFSVRDALQRASSVADHHEWVSEFARLTTVSAQYAWSTLCQVWIRGFVEQGALDAFAEAVRQELNKTI